MSETSLTIKVSSHLKAEVETAAAAMEMSRTEFVRTALELATAEQPAMFASIMDEHRELIAANRRAMEMLEEQRVLYKQIKSEWLHLKAEGVAIKAASNIIKQGREMEAGKTAAEHFGT